MSDDIEISGFGPNSEWANQETQYLKGLPSNKSFSQMKYR